MSTAPMRRPTKYEITAMTAALDQFVNDERSIREAHRTPHHGCLYGPLAT
jgi:hypothetical protein